MLFTSTRPSAVAAAKDLLCGGTAAARMNGEESFSPSPSEGGWEGLGEGAGG